MYAMLMGLEFLLLCVCHMASLCIVHRNTSLQVAYICDVVIRPVSVVIRMLPHVSSDVFSGLMYLVFFKMVQHTSDKLSLWPKASFSS